MSESEKIDLAKLSELVERSIAIGGSLTAVALAISRCLSEGREFSAALLAIAQDYTGKCSEISAQINEIAGDVVVVRGDRALTGLPSGGSENPFRALMEVAFGGGWRKGWHEVVHLPVPPNPPFEPTWTEIDGEWWGCSDDRFRTSRIARIIPFERHADWFELATANRHLRWGEEPWITEQVNFDTVDEAKAFALERIRPTG